MSDGSLLLLQGPRPLKVMYPGHHTATTALRFTLIDGWLLECLKYGCSCLFCFYPGTILYFVTPMQTSHWQPLTQHTPPDEFKISFSRQQETRDAPVESIDEIFHKPPPLSFFVPPLCGRKFGWEIRLQGCVTLRAVWYALGWNVNTVSC